jgi:hypothetical protein
MRIWIKLGYRNVARVIGVLKTLAITLHHEAYKARDKELAKELREDADELDQGAEDIRQRFHHEDPP